MTETMHFVQTFKKEGRRYISGQPQACKTSDQALSMGLRAADRMAGVVVFSVTGEPEFGECDPPVVLALHGDIPQGAF
jgi:hypothetical protein